MTAASRPSSASAESGTSVAAALAASALFRNCDLGLLQVIGRDAPRLQVGRDELLEDALAAAAQVECEAGRGLVVVEQGALRVWVGWGNPVVAGPGTILRVSNFLQLGTIRDGEAQLELPSDEDRMGAYSMPASPIRRRLGFAASRANRFLSSDVLLLSPPTSPTSPKAKHFFSTSDAGAYTPSSSMSPKARHMFSTSDGVLSSTMSPKVERNISLSNQSQKGGVSCSSSVVLGQGQRFDGALALHADIGTGESGERSFSGSRRSFNAPKTTTIHYHQVFSTQLVPAPEMLQLQIVGRHDETAAAETPLLEKGDDEEDDEEETQPSVCRVALISEQAVSTVFLTANTLGAFDKSISFTAKMSYRNYRQNVKEITALWRALLAVSASEVFAGAPDECTWALAEGAQLRKFAAGEKLVTEGDCCEGGLSMICISAGEAIAERQAYNYVTGKVSDEVVCQLSPGAIIGDPRFLGLCMRRPVSIRARTDVTAIEVMPRHLMDVMRRFPGMQSKKRMREAADLVMSHLPPKVEALGSLSLFRLCEFDFVARLACGGQRHIFYGGMVIQAAGCTEGSLNVVEVGLVGLDCRSCGVSTLDGQPPPRRKSEGCIEIGSCGCFGVEAFVSRGGCAVQATARALTPMAIVMRLSCRTLQAELVRFFGEERHFPCISPRIAYVDRGSAMKHLEKCSMFKLCSATFVEELSKSVQRVCYFPGQTLVVEGNVDDAHCFMLRSGDVTIEREGSVVEMKLEETQPVGELALLGVVRRRTATVTAMTFCFTLEVTRRALIATLDTHPTERRGFELLAMAKMRMAPALVWPFLRDLPEEVSFALNMHAERRIYGAGDESLSASAVESAIIVIHGSIALIDAMEEEVGSLSVGQCNNEQALLGINDPELLPRVKYVPQVVSEVQIVTKAAYDAFLQEFPWFGERIETNIIAEIAKKSQLKLGFTLGPPCIVFRAASPVIRSLSDQCLEQLGEKITTSLHMPGYQFTCSGQKANSLLLLLDGVAKQHNDLNLNIELKAGDIIGGDALLAGICGQYLNTVEASSCCFVQALKVSDFEEVLRHFPADLELFDEIQAAARLHSYAQLSRRLEMHECFEHFDVGFRAAIGRGCSHVFFAPREVLPQDSALILVAGSAVVLDDLGGVVCRSRSRLLGEKAWLGREGNHVGIIRAGDEGLLHCAQIKSDAIKSALRSYPHAGELLKEMFDSYAETYEDFQVKRKQWLADVAVPALRDCRLFSTFDAEIIAGIAGTLGEVVYAENEVICHAGAVADSLLILLGGVGLVQSREGTPVGHLRAGASIGEDIALGLFGCRLGTIVALTTCTVMPVPARVIWGELYKECGDDPQSLRAFEKLQEDRRWQVSQGLPLTALPVGLKPDDVAVRAVALNADRFVLDVGSLADLLPDDGANGPHFDVVARGRLALELVDGRHVATLCAGSVLPEGLFGSSRGRLRGLSSCEVYRFKEIDFRLACEAVGSAACDCLERFNLAARTAMVNLTRRLQNAQAHGGQHKDDELRAQAATRVYNVDHANRTRAILDDALSGCKERQLPRCQHSPSQDWATLSKFKGAAGFQEVAAALSLQLGHSTPSRPSSRPTSAGTTLRSDVASSLSRPASAGSILRTDLSHFKPRDKLDLLRLRQRLLLCAAEPSRRPKHRSRSKALAETGGCRSRVITSAA